MQNWEEIKARLREAGSKSRGSLLGGRLQTDTSSQEITRDDIIANLGRPYKEGTMWDLAKSGKYGFMWGVESFDNYEDWKDWFMSQNPENVPLMIAQTKNGQQISPSQPTTTPTSSYTGQSIGGLASYLKASNLSFGTPKTDFDIRSPNFKNLPLPSKTADLISKSGINTVWENPYFKRFFNE